MCPARVSQWGRNLDAALITAYMVGGRQHGRLEARHARNRPAKNQRRGLETHEALLKRRSNIRKSPGGRVACKKACGASHADDSMAPPRWLKWASRRRQLPHIKSCACSLVTMARLTFLFVALLAVAGSAQAVTLAELLTREELKPFITGVQKWRCPWQAPPWRARSSADSWPCCVMAPRPRSPACSSEPPRSLPAALRRGDPNQGVHQRPQTGGIRL